MGTIDYPVIVARMKAAMKSRRITYSDLALSLHMSESGLKKIFAAKDCSIGKLFQIFNVLEISLSDLLEEEAKSRASTIQLNEVQQKAFLEDPLIFKIFWVLTYEGASLDEIKTFWGLEKATLTKALRRLDKLNLLKWGAGDRIQLLSRDMPYWQDAGPFVDKIKRDWSQSLLSESLKQSRERGRTMLALRCLFLSETSYEELQNSMRELIMEFDRRSRRETKLYGTKGTMPCRLLAVLGEGSFIEKPKM